MILQCQSISRMYKSGESNLTVIDKLSLEVEKNGFIAVTGESGCGKSTLLHALGCLDDINGGEIVYKETAYSKLKQFQKDRLRNHEFGFVFQFHHLLPEFNALENVMMPGLIAGKNTTELKKVAEQLLEDMNLSARSHHKPSQLSGGEQQRVAVARALINEPSILFMDEPTGNLDPVKSQQLIDLILEQRKKRDITIILVTHNHEIASQAQWCYELKNGKLNLQ